LPFLIWSGFFFACHAKQLDKLDRGNLSMVPVVWK